MVVGLHTEFLSEFNALASYLTVNGIFRIAVPLFLMINGFHFFFAIKENCQWAWLKRISFLYLIWMSFYSYAWIEIPEWSFFAVGQVIISFLIGYWHLWYISSMLGAAFLMMAVKSRSPQFMLLLAGMAFLLGVAIQYAGNYHMLPGTVYDVAFNFHPFHRNAVFFSFPFFCAGYLINKYSIQDFISLRLAFLGLISGCALLIIESYLNFLQPGRDGEFDNYASLALVCPIVFILTLKLHVKGRGKKLSEYSAAIYFIHVFVIHFIFIFVDISGSLLTLIVIFLSIPASMLLVKMNHKLKIIL